MLVMAKIEFIDKLGATSFNAINSRLMDFETTSGHSQVFIIASLVGAIKLVS